MNVDEFKSMLLDHIRSSESSSEFDNWVGDCILLAYERGDIDCRVHEEIDELEIATIRDETTGQLNQ